MAVSPKPSPPTRMPPTSPPRPGHTKLSSRMHRTDNIQCKTVRSPCLALRFPPPPVHPTRTPSWASDDNSLIIKEIMRTTKHAMSFFWIGTVITLLVSIHPVSGFYDPGLQRWLNRDPLAERGGRHLLCFVQNNPTIYFDRWGLVRSGVTSDGRPYMENPFAGSPIGTVYCRGQKPVIWNPDTNPVLKQCSDAHEMQHLEDDLEHYGANCCAGIPDGFSPGSDDEATRKFTL